MKRHEVDAIVRRTVEGDLAAQEQLRMRLTSTAHEAVERAVDEVRSIGDLVCAEAGAAGEAIAALQRSVSSLSARLRDDEQLPGLDVVETMELRAAASARLELWVRYLAHLHTVAAEMSPAGWRVPELCREAEDRAVALGRSPAPWARAEKAWLDGRACLILGMSRRMADDAEVTS